MTWTEPDATSWSGPNYNGGDDVVFSGSGQGTISVPNVVTPGAFSISSGTYQFTGTNINATSFTLSGGNLQWSIDGQLGTGPIYVTGDAVLESTKTSGPATMNNSSITISDNVTLTIRQRNPNNAPTGSPTIAPILGGSVGNPIHVVLQTSNQLARVRFSTSPTWVGDITFNNRFTVEGFNDNQFGVAANKIILNATGGIGTGGNPEWNSTTTRDMDINSFAILSGAIELSGRVFQATNLGTFITEVSGGGSEVYLRNTASSFTQPSGFGGLQLNNGRFRTDVTIPVSRFMVVGNNNNVGGENVQVRFSNAGGTTISNSASFIMGVTGTNTIKVDNSGAKVRYLGDLNTISSGGNGERVFRKTGLGTLILAGGDAGTSAARPVSLLNAESSLVLDSTFINISNVTVSAGASLSLNPDTAGGAAGNLTVGGDLTLASTSALTLELLNTSAYDRLTVTGAVSLAGSTLTLTNLPGFAAAKGDVFTLIDNLGADGVVGEFAGLPNGSEFSLYSPIPTVTGYKILYNGGTGNDVLLIAVPEPSSISLLAVVGSLLAVRRSRRLR